MTFVRFNINAYNCHLKFDNFDGMVAHTDICPYCSNDYKSITQIQIKNRLIKCTKCHLSFIQSYLIAQRNYIIVNEYYKYSHTDPHWNNHRMWYECNTYNAMVWFSTISINRSNSYE